MFGQARDVVQRIIHLHARNAAVVVVRDVDVIFGSSHANGPVQRDGRYGNGAGATNLGQAEG